MSTPILQSVFRAARPVRSHEATTFIRSCRARPIHTPSYHSHHNAQTQRLRRPSSPRSFSTTSSIRATAVVQNPRQDEDGNDMLITISERAAKRLKQITSTQPKRNTLATTQSNPSDSHLRVTVTSGGCHGFQYLMSLEPSSKIDADEDTVFIAEGASPADGNAKVVLDESSLELLKGSTVDFTTELIGSQFKIVGNPRATSSCGCGTSFDIE